MRGRPLYDVTGWASSAAMAELFGVPAGLLNDDRLGRALEALAPVAERVRGELALAAASRCGADLSRLHLDMTAVRFTGGYQGSALVAKGWAADRTIARQVKTCSIDPHRGRGLLPRASGRIQRGALPGRRAGPHPRAGPARGHRVADSGFGYLGRLCAADAAGLRFVVPLRADTGWAQWFAADIDGGIDALPPSTTAPNANGGCPPISAPVEGRARPPRSSTTTPAAPTGCASPTSGPPKKPPPSPTPRPRPDQGRGALTRIRNGLAGVTTRPASRSTTGSPRSSAPASPT